MNREVSIIRTELDPKGCLVLNVVNHRYPTWLLAIEDHTVSTNPKEPTIAWKESPPNGVFEIFLVWIKPTKGKWMNRVWTKPINSSPMKDCKPNQPRFLTEEKDMIHRSKSKPKNTWADRVCWEDLPSDQKTFNFWGSQIPPKMLTTIWITTQ